MLTSTLCGGVTANESGGREGERHGNKTQERAHFRLCQCVAAGKRGPWRKTATL
jgi:hypothetical protein